MRKNRKTQENFDNSKNVNTAPQNEQENGKRTGRYSELVGVHRAVPIILVAAGIFLAVCYFNGMTGLFGTAVAKFLRGLFSVGAYIIPLLLVVHGIFYPSDVAKKRALSRLIFSVATVLFISVVAYAVMYIRADVKPEFTPKDYYAMGKEHRGGGFFGSLLAYGIIKIFGSVGLIIITSAVFAIYIVYFFSDGHGTFGKICLGILSALANVGAFIERKVKRLFGRVKNAKKAKDKRISVQKSRDLSEDEFFMVDNGMQDFEISELGIKETRTSESVEENPTLHEKVRFKSKVEGDFSSDFGERESSRVFEGDGEQRSERRRILHTDINLDDTVSEDDGDENDIVYDEPVSRKFTVEDSADSIFARDFDPFDLSESERLAAKPSSKAKTSAERMQPRYTEDISSITPEDVERARRQAEFEMKKRSIMENYRTNEEKKEERQNPEEQITEESPVQTAEPQPFDNNDSSSIYDSFGTEQQVGDNKSPSEEPRRTSSYTFTPLFDTDEAYSASGEVRESEPMQSDVKRRDYERVARFSAGITEQLRHEPAVENEMSPKEQAPQNETPYASTTPDFDEYSEEMADEPTPRSTITLEREFVSSGAQSLYSDEEDDEELSEELLAAGESEDTAAEPEIIPEAERNPKIDEYRSMFPALSDEDEPEPGLVFEREEPAFTESEPEEDDEPPFETEDKNEPEPEPPKVKKKDYSKYKFPPISILAPEDADESDDIQAEIEDNANKLISTLESFRVKASIKGVDRGPRITRYEIVPATGVKVSSVMSLQNDIALNLAAEGIRMEAPIPGKSAIGFEIPNRKPSTVRLRSLLETEEFIGSKSKTTVCIGKDVAGCPVFGDIAKMPHVLIAGATGMGKSVCINSILISMLYKARPDEVKFIMIDPKKVEFTMYNGIPHLLIPVVTDPKQAAGALMWAVEQMEKRYEMIEKMRVRNIEMYNEKIAKDPSLGEPMSKIIVVIDELNDLMLQVRDPVEGLIMSIAQKARAAGIHLIIGTQRPSVDVITGVIKANIPSRISCKVMSNTDSRTILDQKGAEDLLDKGDMLFFPAGKPKPARVQGAFVSDGEVEEIMEFLKNQGGDGENYDSEVMEEIQRNAQRCNKKSSDDFDDDGSDDEDGAGYLNDQKFLDAVNVAVTTGKISTSLLQRKLSIGYGKAAKYVDIMEDMGIVSESNGQKAREVLITKDEWHEKLARISLDDY